MVKVRQDAWSHEDDLLLAETVLRHIRDGSTQLNAFEEVGDALNRTSAACGFRWNAEIRNKYIDAIDLAKRQRKEKKRALAKTSKQSLMPDISLYEHNNLANEKKEEETADLSIEKIIVSLQHMKKNLSQQSYDSNKITRLKVENEELKSTISSLQQEQKTTQKRFSDMKEDYQTFVQIMDRARKMTVLNDEEPLKSPAFKMEKNGYLEHITPDQA